ncbi:hypothetical protein NNA34_10325 [Lacticaseibacillus paracasei]|jgi:hypothetical protein|uniref:hypothetical protein n=1 Tax=Lacticaseibacillus paracasei TaxID=1597 RepID=UPI00209C9072|nr:hypothetical protein [Lacticaseibacillus paracasei]MDS0490683.1 hypothetical protein [Lacticaseibacillus paracasei]MEA0973126.1 hypothetical protein [Lacticaseibacillus paracasei]UVH22911.1 hypothetical protein NJN40_09285 [Lacticaseibacillus paracasei]
MDGFLQNMLNNESVSSVIALIFNSASLIFQGNNKKDDEEVSAVAIESDKSSAVLTLNSRVIDGVDKLYAFDAFSEIRFALSKGTPTEVFALYSKIDNIVSGKDGTEQIEFKKLKKKSKNGRTFIYSFDKDYVYSSRFANKVKPFLVFIQTKHKLHIIVVIMRQKPQGETINLGNKAWFRSMPQVSFNAESAEAYLENQLNKISEKYSDEFEVMETLKVIRELKSKIELGFIN